MMIRSQSIYDDLIDEIQANKVNDDIFSSSLFNDELNALKQNENNINHETDSEFDVTLARSLKQFDSHGLKDLNNAKLMNRVDSKFLLPISFLPEVLDQLKDLYSALEIKGNRVSEYENQYFDTPELSLYRDHHNGKLNRYKVRRRHYIDTQTTFLEGKLKNNQKRTIKTRIKLTGGAGEYAKCAQFITDNVEKTLHNLAVSQHSGYQRIALANEAQAERLTLDFNLWFQCRRGHKKVTLPRFFIAELKQAKKSKISPFYQLMTANNMFPTAFSKYCLGCALLYNNSIKTNRFKPILSKVDKFHQSTFNQSKCIPSNPKKTLKSN